MVPLIAWVRPYNGNWFPGSSVDVLLREIEFAVERPQASWAEIVDSVRPHVWETGVGAEIIVDEPRLWALVRAVAMRRLESAKYIASVARTDPGQMSEVTLEEVRTWPERSSEERKAYWVPFAKDLERQLKRHGDERLDDCETAAAGFASENFNLVEAMIAKGGDPIERLLEHFGIPPEITSPKMSIADLGLLCVYSRQLAILGRKLRTPFPLNAKDLPPGRLPSHVLSGRLESLQRTADRVSGSDLGDQHIASLILYSEFVEVDKRTGEHLRRIQKKDQGLASLMGHFGRHPRYDELIGLIEQGNPKGSAPSAPTGH